MDTSYPNNKRPTSTYRRIGGIEMNHSKDDLVKQSLLNRIIRLTVEVTEMEAENDVKQNRINELEQKLGEKRVEEKANAKKKGVIFLWGNTRMSIDTKASD